MCAFSRCDCDLLVFATYDVEAAVSIAQPNIQNIHQGCSKPPVFKQPSYILLGVELGEPTWPSLGGKR